MKTIISKSYSIVFGEKSYENLYEIIKENNYSKIFILTDTNTSEYCLPHFLAHFATEVPFEIIEIEAGEIHKNIETCFEVWNALEELEGDRKSLLLTLGGGTVSDLGGFVASTYKRGIHSIHIPTTLLAMVDASVGGKTGVNLGSLKNLIGTFSLPKMVLIDVSYLQTLPQNEMQSGLAEMLKHGLIADMDYWNELKDLSNLTTDDLERLIHRSIEIKNNIVLQDYEEQHLRKGLNFGHTLGHAIESLFLEDPEKEKLLHGFAIAQGMILEAYLSYKKEFISLTFYEEIKEIIRSIFDKVDLSDNDVQTIFSLLTHDKKNAFGEVNFTLLKNRGEFSYNELVTNDLISEAIHDYLK
ncbi:3-dehydroquinate synthase [Myroides ceti]|uniref:3-dehydroquinate synthase n=1 Tax=Paenimyroides ceti TaxID=395087 RepID=A0ABT8CR69_9FLAO|nr:3-dehydroquinate synthase [Paenimyroides ceti]MDN3706997.1 3-dehydroquinate synthase [Paenimyroides ceti]